MPKPSRRRKKPSVRRSPGEPVAPWRGGGLRAAALLVAVLALLAAALVVAVDLMGGG